MVVLLFSKICKRIQFTDIRYCMMRCTVHEKLGLDNRITYIKAGTLVDKANRSVSVTVSCLVLNAKRRFYANML